mmetsp:Transcript_59764/g.53815  ORF Transcript_59764/g.53815 Transcript_59764/m.53815 type:complete len:87 (-) Transcript_59764:623-883(-)
MRQQPKTIVAMSLLQICQDYRAISSYIIFETGGIAMAKIACAINFSSGFLLRQIGILWNVRFKLILFKMVESMTFSILLSQCAIAN